jgi:predicted lysophospholipase L1 biosynthesis ABC-type transport system permease subunit
MTTSEETLDSLRPLTLAVLAPLAALVAVFAITASAASSQTVWYVIRGTGVIAYGLLALSVAFGLLITRRRGPPRRVPR